MIKVAENYSSEEMSKSDRYKDRIKIDAVGRRKNHVFENGEE
ncbi:hypothetical protein [Terribacillus sp. AE2B 122]|nr:hypothetical protein [Terribacillus sp. AE2B 122]